MVHFQTFSNYIFTSESTFLKILNKYIISTDEQINNPGVFYQIALHQSYTNIPNKYGVTLWFYPANKLNYVQKKHKCKKCRKYTYYYSKD